MMKNHYLNSHAHLLPPAIESWKKERPTAALYGFLVYPTNSMFCRKKAKICFVWLSTTTDWCFFFSPGESRALTLCLLTHQFSNFVFMAGLKRIGCFFMTSGDTLWRNHRFFISFPASLKPWEVKSHAPLRYEKLFFLVTCTILTNYFVWGV